MFIINHFNFSVYIGHHPFIRGKLQTAKANAPQ